jgi:FHA domain
MTVTCPGGHASQTTDYCDQCGAPIQAAGDEELDTSPATSRQPCPVCDAPRSGDGDYCEGCGYDFTRPPPRAAGWDAIATADRQRFERQSTDGISFPSDYGERRFALDRPEIRIGRSRAGKERPDIDLGGEHADPGISHLHALLTRQDDGSYALSDLHSTNGTVLNDGSLEVSRDVAVPLQDRDQIHLGAWTTITLRRR